MHVAGRDVRPNEEVVHACTKITLGFSVLSVACTYVWLGDCARTRDVRNSFRSLYSAFMQRKTITANGQVHRVKTKKLTSRQTYFNAEDMNVINWRRKECQWNQSIGWDPVLSTVEFIFVVGKTMTNDDLPNCVLYRRVILLRNFQLADKKNKKLKKFLFCFVFQE